jgi:hypothetical protein
MDMGKKVGPFPIGVWLVLVVAGVGIGWYYTRGGVASPPDGGEGDLQDLGSGDQIGDGPGGWSLIPPVPNPPPTSNTGITLPEWERKALKALDSRTKTDPLLAQSALHRYVNCQPLSDKQIAVIKLAHQLVGPPPVYLPIKHQTGSGKTPPPVKPPPHPDPSPKPGTGKWYTIRKGDTLDKIATRFYDNPGSRKLDIFHANRKGADRPGPTPGFMDRPNDLPPGKWLWIPGPTKIVAQPGVMA